jgi:sec-independent protein translocase protein TatA
MPNIGGTEIFLILIVALLLFGAKNLPKMARSLGKSVEEFRRAAREVSREVMQADQSDPPSPPSPPPPHQIASGMEPPPPPPEVASGEEPPPPSPEIASGEGLPTSPPEIASGEAPRKESPDEGRG